jgi:hypothetical protein
VSARSVLTLMLLTAWLAAPAWPGEAPAAPAPAPTAAPEPENAEAREFKRRMRTEVTRFGFEEPAIVEPGRTPLPREWERHLEYVFERTAGGQPQRFFGRYPDFLTVETVDRTVPGTPPDAVHGGNRALRMSLAGSKDMDLVAVKRRIPLDINPDFAYELTGWLRLQGVRKPESWARLGIEWLDSQGRPIGEKRWSDKVNLRWLEQHREGGRAPSGPAWGPTPELRVNDVEREARAARIWCEASGREPEAWVSFDDIELRRRPKVSVGRPRISAETELPGWFGIFAANEVPTLELKFTGLDAPAPSGRAGPPAAPARYLRQVAAEDLFGRKIAIPDQEFDTRDIRDDRLEEVLRLEALNRPGAYGVQVSLLAIGSGGEREEKARRVLRLVKLAADPKLSDDPAPNSFGVETGLYGQDAAQLLLALERLGIRSPAAVRLGDIPGPASAPASGGGGELPAGERLARKLRGLVGRQLQAEWVLGSPAASEGAAGRADAATLYSSDDWRAAVRRMAGDFLPLKGSWRLAAAKDGSLGTRSREDRVKLAAEFRSATLEGAAGKVVSVPLGLDRLDVSVPPAGGDYRELVFVPASTGREQLQRLFPAPALAARTAQGYEWFLELGKSSENLGLSLKDERAQVQDLARKATLLAVAGAGRFVTELSEPQQGLLGPELNPRPAYAAWRTLGQYLSGAEFLGQFDLSRDADVSAWAFRLGEQGLVVFWTDGKERDIPAQLGSRGRTQLVEITGAGRALRPARGPAEAGDLLEAEMVPLSPTPAILVGLEPAFVRTRQSFQLAAGSKVQCLYEPMPVAFNLRNHFNADMSVKVFPRFPPGSAVSPRFRSFSIKAGESEKIEFNVRPSFVETLGEKEVTVDLYLSARDRRDIFTITRKIPYESMLSLEPILPLTIEDDGRVAQVRLAAGIKAGARPEGTLTDLEVYLSVPGFGRQRTVIEDVPAGKSRQIDDPFTVILGAREQTVYAGVRERNGNWFANVEFKVPAASPPRFSERR